MLTHGKMSVTLFCTMLMLTLTVTLSCGATESPNAGPPPLNLHALKQAAPSAQFAYCTLWVNDKTVKIPNRDEQPENVLALAVPIAKSGNVTFCLPLIVPKLTETNQRGDVGLTVRADLVRGMF